MKLCNLKWLKRKTRPVFPASLKRSLKVVDLFSGCGGMSLGAWEAARNNHLGFDLVLAVDTFPDAIKVLSDNFCDYSSTKDFRTSKVEEIFSSSTSGRLRKSEKSLLENLTEIDVLLAGPPCQGNSDLNNSTRRNDPRNALYGYVARAMKVLKPKFAIIENVPTVIHDRGGVVSSVKSQVEKMGYSTKELIVDFSKLGVAQKRKRHLLVCSFEKNLEKFEIAESSVEMPLSKVLSDIRKTDERSVFHRRSELQAINQKRIDFLFDNDLHDLPNEQRPDCHKNKKHSYNSMYGRLHWEKPSQTITTGFGSPGQGRFIHPLERRLITPYEAARIQYFPDFYKFDSLQKKTSLQKVIGNAVPPKAVTLILNELLSLGYE